MLSFGLGSHAALALEWGATVNTAYSTVQADTARTLTFDQQYSLNVRGALAPSFQYYSSLQMRRLQIAQNDTARNHLTELNPNVSGVWTLPLCRLSSDYSYRRNRDHSESDALIGRSAGVSLQSTWQTLPMLQGYYAWNQNLNDLDLLGKDTREQTLAPPPATAPRPRPFATITATAARAAR